MITTVPSKSSIQRSTIYIKVDLLTIWHLRPFSPWDLPIAYIVRTTGYAPHSKPLRNQSASSETHTLYGNCVSCVHTGIVCNTAVELACPFDLRSNSSPIIVETGR